MDVPSAPTLKTTLIAIVRNSAGDRLKRFIQSYLDNKDLTNFYELVYVVNMIKLASDDVNDLNAVINTMHWSIPSGEALNLLCSLLVSRDVHRLNPSASFDVLTALLENLKVDNPAHLRLPGDKDSYLQVQTNGPGMVGLRSFTATLWAKVDPDYSNKGFFLFRCLSHKGGIDVILQDREPSGEWTIVMRTYVDRDRSTQKREVKGLVYFTLGAWHQFAMRHDENNKISFLVDGSLELERELPYQFSTSAQYKWTSGTFLRGGIAGISFYSESLSQSALSVLHGLGPYTRSIATGVASVPQSSFDTGHTVLGTRISKGSLGSKLCRLPVLLNLTAANLQEGANLPQYPMGRVQTDYTEMVPRPNMHSSFGSPSYTGGCRLSLPSTWVGAWLDAGGCAVLMYLVGHFCAEANRECDKYLDIERESEENSVSLITHTEEALMHMKCVKSAIALLTELVKVSAEAKEQLLQIHGLHVLGHCLATLQRKDILVDLDLVSLCCDVLPALGIDAKAGDGVAATLQGLLFDFRVWGDTTLEVKMDHLFRIAVLTVDRGDELEKSIGVQRLLDILRLHVLRQEAPTCGQGQGEVPGQEGGHVACAEAGYTLLTIATDAGLEQFAKGGNRDIVLTDLEALLGCLEETSSCLLVERVLRVLLKFRDAIPDLLVEVITRTRFADTTAVTLMSRRHLSAEAYRETLALALWGLSKEYSLDNDVLLALRKTLVCPVTPVVEEVGTNTQGRKKLRLAHQASAADMKRLADGNEQIKSSMKGALKAWSVVSMLATLVARAISEGNWDAVDAHSTMYLVRASSPISSANSGTGGLDEVVSYVPNPEAMKQRLRVIHEVLSVFHSVGPFGGRPDFWMVLPLLPALLGYCGDLTIMQQVLSSLTVALKTDEGQVETICNLPDRGWTKILIDLAVIAEIYALRMLNLALNQSQNQNEESQNNQALTRSIDKLQNHEHAMAATCTELALEAAATMLEHKIRYHDQDAWSCWNSLQNCIKASCSTFKRLGYALERTLVKRCLTLVFQRLARSTEPWNMGMLLFLENILMLVSNKGLCGQDTAPPGVALEIGIGVGGLGLDGATSPERSTKFAITDGWGLQSAQTTARIGSSIGLGHGLPIQAAGATPIPQTVEETQLLLFVADLATALRRAASRQSPPMFGREGLAVRIVLNILLNSLRVCNEAVADRIVNEIYNNVVYAAKHNVTVMSADEYRQLLVLVFTRLEAAIREQTLSQTLLDKYRALVFRLAHHLGDQRRLANRQTLHIGDEPVPAHVVPTVDALSGIENCRDADAVFELIRIAVVFADSISFDGFEPFDVDMNDVAAALAGFSCVEDPQNSNQNQLQQELSVQQQLKEQTISPPKVEVTQHLRETPRLRSSSIESSGSSGGGTSRSRRGSFTALSLLSPARSSSLILPEPGLGSRPSSRPSSQPVSRRTSFTMTHKEGTNSRPVSDHLDISNIEGVGMSSSSKSLSFPTKVSSVAIETNDQKKIQQEWPVLDLTVASRDPAYMQWVDARRGMVTDRVDSERLRLQQSVHSLDLGAAAVHRHWSRLMRKVESESFLLNHTCQWKLGIAHEGPPPGRRRLVLRPRFDLPAVNPRKINDGDDKDTGKDKEDGSEDTGALVSVGAAVSGDDAERVRQTLAASFAGYIHDVARMSSDDGAVAADIDVNAHKSATQAPMPAPGDGWGLVGADGSEEGFGIVGLALVTSRDMYEDGCQGAFVPGKTSEVLGKEEATVGGGKILRMDSLGSSVGMSIGDMNGDLRQVEEALQQGRRVDTGPCQTGTRRMNHGPPTHTARVIMVTASGNYPGTMSLAPKDVYFVSSAERPGSEGQHDAGVVNLARERQLRGRRRRWTVSSISAVYLRRYRLRETAIEVFFRRGKHRHFFVDFGPTKEDAKARSFFAKALMEAAPSSAIKQWPLMSPFRLVSEHRIQDRNIQDRWIRGEISNFDYLMALNTISGRSFNDLCQYPVFPWVIADYSSPTLDLSNPSVYRDLSKPMGAQNEERLREFLDRYESFAENETIQNIPPFMYGSHYSTMVGVVLHFLLRMQPFASLHKEMQSGRFDVADRLFFSVPLTYQHNTKNMSEVKELTPEWFTTPEMFRNTNNLDLGVTQDGRAINDVELPPWASSAEEFVHINREALEGEYVSAHLHEWIDLIFGYKQVGPAAVEAHNVFYYLTYAGSMDRQLIEDKILRDAVELQIAHFGQIPQQLFRAPHPPRQPPSARAASISLPRPLKKCFTANPVTSYNTTITYAPDGGSNPLVKRRVSNAAASPLITGTNVSTTIEASIVEPGQFVPWPAVPATTDTLTISTSGPFVAPTCDEEEIAIASRNALVARRNPGLAIRTSHENSLANTGATSLSSATVLSVTSTWKGNFNERGPSVAVGNVLCFFLCTERIVAVVDSGVIEVFKYMVSESAKLALSQAQAGSRAGARRRAESASTVNSASNLAANRRLAAAMALADPDIITFEDFLLSPQYPSPVSAGPTSLQGSRMESVNALSGSLQGSRHTESTSLIAPSPFADWHDSLIAVERDSTHFEVLPRIPLAGAWGNGAPRPSTVEQVELSAKLVHFSRSGSLLFSAGHVDGSVYVREIDGRTGFIVSAGDFLGHRHRVVSISSDFISGSNTDVIASCDAFGQIMVWTVFQSQGQQAGTKTYIISRRPQRIFRCEACANLCLDISWQMGIVAVASQHSVRVFSIEREELLRRLDLSALFLPEGALNAATVRILNERSSTLCICTVAQHAVEYLNVKNVGVKSAATAATADGAASDREADWTHPYANTECSSVDNTDAENSWNLSKRLVLHRVALCNDGIIVVHATTPVQNRRPSFPNLKSVVDKDIFSDAVGSSTHTLVALSLAGYQTGRVTLPSALTFLDCVNRSDVVLTGFMDGRVALYSTHDLSLLYEFKPYQDAVYVHSTVPSAVGIPPTAAPIIHAKVGPNESAPAMLCVSTTMAEMYLRPLPDFIRWERGRTPSALQQIVSAPVRAVQDLGERVNKLGASTREHADEIAKNIASVAEETLSKDASVYELVQGG